MAKKSKEAVEHLDARVLDVLIDTVAARHREFSDGATSESRTVKLFTAGVPKIAQKVGEEATETIIEAVRGKKKLLVEESVDLLYHLTVLWAACDVPATQVWAEIAKRHGLPEELERAMREASKQSEQ